jgi:hypothetical protein
VTTKRFSPKLVDGFHSESVVTLTKKRGEVSSRSGADVEDAAACGKRHLHVGRDGTGDSLVTLNQFASVSTVELRGDRIHD